MTSIENEEQGRRAARLILDAFREQARAEAELELPAKGKWAASAPAWIACALSIFAVLWQAAVTTSRVSENTRRIESLETERSDRVAADSRVIDRLARIEAKLDLVTEGKAR